MTPLSSVAAGVSPLVLIALRDYHAHLMTPVAEVRAAQGAHPLPRRSCTDAPKVREVRELLEAALERLEDYAR